MNKKDRVIALIPKKRYYTFFFFLTLNYYRKKHLLFYTFFSSYKYKLKNLIKIRKLKIFILFFSKTFQVSFEKCIHSKVLVIIRESSSRKILE